ncbi:Tn3 family transposase [Streptomyces brevispora]|uniref:Tn3 family transposase n=1 Tax=Streptomyces brevispora TaxID=887462 RepID=UPI0035D987A1
MLKDIDADGPAQLALAKAVEMTAETRAALEGLDEEASADEVVRRLGGKVSPALLAFIKALVVQAGGLATVTKTVEGFGGFAQQYEQIEKVSAHHGNLWETSEVKPTTVHADTQGQSQPVFALAHLLGFDLMPRIRNWKGLTFYRPSKQTEYVHIDALFGEPGKTQLTGT